MIASYAEDVALLSKAGLRAALNFHNIQYEDSYHKAYTFSKLAQRHCSSAQRIADELDSRRATQDSADIPDTIAKRSVKKQEDETMEE